MLCAHHSRFLRLWDGKWRGSWCWCSGVIVYRLARVFVTCGVEWNTRGETCLAFLRSELAGIHWMMYRGGSELWLLSFSMATCRLGWILWFPSFKLEVSNHKYNHDSIQIFDISGVNMENINQRDLGLRQLISVQVYDFIDRVSGKAEAKGFNSTTHC